MFGKKKQNEKKESLNFKSDNYKLNDDNYVTNNLVVANLEYIIIARPITAASRHTDM